MLGFRTRRDRRVRLSARGAGSWNRAAPGVVEFAVRAPEKLVDPLTRGDPQSPLRWTCKSREATSHPDCNAQSAHINSKADDFLQRAAGGVCLYQEEGTGGGFQERPAGSGSLRNHWCTTFPKTRQARRLPTASMTWDAPKHGPDHDTPAFAVASLRRWWEEMGKSRELFITADASGGNGHRSYRVEARVAAVCRRHACAYPLPPGTSKWNKIEHRVCCHITQNWRGKPLRTFETIVDPTRHSRNQRFAMV